LQGLVNVVEISGFFVGREAVDCFSIPFSALRHEPCNFAVDVTYAHSKCLLWTKTKTLKTYKQNTNGPIIFSLVHSMKEAEMSMPANSLQERERLGVFHGTF
jgi:hypothetical protein